MATVHVGRKKGASGFSRLVAIKRAHAFIAGDPAQRHAIVEEARLASKLHHPNVVAVQDVEELDRELLLVMDYVEGASLSELLTAASAANRRVPPRAVIRVVLDVCAGLHAAHSLLDDLGGPLALVHRDVSPQNVLVGLDGVARLTDFGIAKPVDRSASSNTLSGVLKGKMAYMAPEYVQGARPDARADIFAVGAVLWESLAHDRLFRGANEIETLQRVIELDPPRLCGRVAGVTAEIEGVVRRALEKDPARRFASVDELAHALERAARAVDLEGRGAEVAAEVREYVGPKLERRRGELRRLLSADGSPPGPGRAELTRGVDEQVAPSPREPEGEVSPVSERTVPDPPREVPTDLRVTTPMKPVGTDSTAATVVARPDAATATLAGPALSHDDEPPTLLRAPSPELVEVASEEQREAFAAEGTGRSAHWAASIARPPKQSSTLAWVTSALVVAALASVAIYLGLVAPRPERTGATEPERPPTRVDPAAARTPTEPAAPTVSSVAEVAPAGASAAILTSPSASGEGGGPTFPLPSARRPGPVEAALSAPPRATAGAGPSVRAPSPKPSATSAYEPNPYRRP